MGSNRKAPLEMNNLEILRFLFQLLTADPGSPVEGRPYWDTVNHCFKVYNGTSFIAGGATLDQIGAAAADVDLHSHKLINVTDPTSAQHAATRGWTLGLKISDLTALAADYSFNSHKLTSLADGSGANDGVNKGQLDAAIATISAAVSAVAAGISWKDSVRAASTTNVTLASAVENGDTLGGTVLATGDRVGLFGQTAGAENGIYTVNASGAPTRAADADSGPKIEGTFVAVEEGTNAGKIYYLTTDAITINVTSQSWSEFTGVTYTAGNGLALTGVDFNVGAGTGILANANDVAIDTSLVVRKVEGTLGDGATTAIVLTHNFNTRGVHVSVWDTVTPFEEFEMTVKKTSVNTVTLEFAVAPTLNQYGYSIHG